jgi:hypothetical protein
MIVNANDYRVNMKSIELMFKAKKDDIERREFIGSVAVATGVPIIVVAQYLGEIYGFTPQLDSFMDRLKHFYKITELRGCNHI